MIPDWIGSYGEEVLQSNFKNGAEAESDLVDNGWFKKTKTKEAFRGLW